MAKGSLIKGGLGLQKPGGMSAPKIRPPRLAITSKVAMAKGVGMGAGGSPTSIANPPALAKNTQAQAEQQFARGGRVGKPKAGVKKGKK